MFFAALASGMFDLPGGSGMVMLFFGDLNTNIRNLPCLRKLGPSKHLDLPMSFFQICLAPLAQKIIKVRLVENGCNENDKNHHVTMLRHVTATKWCEMARNVATSMGVIIYSGFSHSYSMVI